MLEIGNGNLFDDLTNITCNSFNIDLHNSYYCNCWKFDKEISELRMTFNAALTTENPRQIELLFIDVELSDALVSFEEGEENKTISAFYRGRFQLGNELFEFDQFGRSYFYIEFLGKSRIELFARSCRLSFHVD